jgi:hypothetical protein
MLIVFISMLPGVSAAGHFGGAAAGAAFTLPFIWERYHTGIKRWLGLAGMVIVPIACVAIAARWSRPDRTMDQMHALEDAQNTAIRMYRRYAVPMLEADPGKLFDDQENVNDALEAFTQARAKLDGALAILQEDDAPPLQNPQKAEEILKAWRSFFDGFIDVLEHRVDWNQRQHEALIDRVPKQR